MDKLDELLISNKLYTSVHFLIPANIYEFYNRNLVRKNGADFFPAYKIFSLSSLILAMF